MQFSIRHTTRYQYSQPVILEPHLLRLRPRSDADQTVNSFDLKIEPLPTGSSTLVDLEGNSTIQAWFQEPTDHLHLTTTVTVTTQRPNPFDYLLLPWANEIPIDYPISILSQLHPYLHASVLPHSPSPDPSVWNLAQEILRSVTGQTSLFLTQLNQQIHASCQYEIRETGEPWDPGYTWNQKRGSCRDLTVLFMEACRSVGLAARFVSGYGDPGQGQAHLHAWAEVYVPGGGWRGYDPTQGLAVADQHIALAASALPRLAAPVSGRFQASGIRSEMEYELVIQGQSDP